MADSIKKVAVADEKDGFEDIPEELLQLLMLFLPLRDAVRTSLLAHRWRNLWKSISSLRIYTDEFNSVQAFNNFVNKLLEFRDRTAPLDVCEIHPCLGGCEPEAHQDVESWVQYVVSCKVSVFRIQTACGDPDHGYMHLPNRTVISKHLTVLDIYHLEFEEHPLDLLSCQALKVLEIDDCFINLGNILPKSLQHLKIIDSYLFSTHTQRACISAPGLLTFELDECKGWNQILESLPSLVTSFIHDGSNSDDFCYKKLFGDCGRKSCDRCSVKDDCCVLFKGLSGATN